MKKTDATTYLQKNVKIRTGNKLIPFKLKPVQKDVFVIIGEKKKIIFLKARQLGITSAITGYLYHYAVTNRNTISILIGYNSDLTAELLDKVKTFWKTTPKKSQPNVQYKSKNEIYFPKTNSTLLFLPATEISSIKRLIEKSVPSITFSKMNIFALEVAFWDDAEEKIEELEQILDSNGKFIIESSPNKTEEDGKINYLYKLWIEDNDWHKKRYDWHWGYSPKEIDIIKKKFVDPRKFSREYENVFLADQTETSTLKNWEKATTKLVEQFITKYFGKGEEWFAISDEIEGVICVGDYFWNLDDIVTAMRYGATEDQVFDYYDTALDFSLKEKPMNVSFRNFLKHNMPLK